MMKDMVAIAIHTSPSSGVGRILRQHQPALWSSEAGGVGGATDERAAAK